MNGMELGWYYVDPRAPFWGRQVRHWFPVAMRYSVPGQASVELAFMSFLLKHRDLVDACYFGSPLTIDRLRMTPWAPIALCRPSLLGAVTGWSYRTFRLVLVGEEVFVVVLSYEEFAEGGRG